MVEIVSSLRNFSSVAQERPQLIDIHQYIIFINLIFNSVDALLKKQKYQKMLLQNLVPKPILDILTS